MVPVRWPQVKIVLSAGSGSGFGQGALMARREQNHMDYLFGMAFNKRLRKIIGRQLRS